ncbi:MAG: peptidylprolyl isomerase [Ignavibacteria bacterium]|nr:peptidylprolyl isomerase [Ignavibacteria bacterium]
MKKLLREPLLHFSLIGLMLFLVFGLTGSTEPDRFEIIVSVAQVERMAEIWTRTWQRPPTTQELQGLIDDHVREEVLAREAVAIGLEKDDTIIRRRLRQKMEFLSEDLVGPADPTDEELQAFLVEEQQRFMIPSLYTFRHIYFSPDRRGDSCEEDAIRARDALNSAGEKPEHLGDPYPLPLEHERISQQDAGRLFGETFASQLATLPLNSWSGPVVSGYGLHLVRVEAMTEARLPGLDEVRRDVGREWEVSQRKKANEEFYRELRGKYEVVVEAQNPN